MTTVREHMTTSPHTIGDAQSVEEAARRMSRYQIRHLPVLRGGELVGIVSDRDVRLVEGLGLEQTPVGEAMSPEVFTVDATDELGDVVAHMSSQKKGSAVVLDHGHVIGIFTTTDALGYLSRLLAIEELRTKGF